MSFTVRKATKDDVSDLAHLHVQGWRDAYGGLLDADYIESKTVALREKQWAEWFDEDLTKTLIAYDENGTAAGFISFGKLKTPPPGMSPIRPLYAAEIYAFYILEPFWRQGLGTKFMHEASNVLAAEKVKSICLWVLEKNKRAVSFYKKTGGERCGKMDVEFGPTKAREICFGWRDTSRFIEVAE
jgi:GNAT superfamily N-acetyltransferase